MKHRSNARQDYAHRQDRLVYPGGGGSRDCDPKNEKHRFLMIGPPTGGTWVCPYVVNSTSANATINWNTTATQFRDAIVAAHSELTDDNFIVTGGPLPFIPLDVEFKDDLAAHRVELPLHNASGLTGAGIGVVAIRVNEGFPQIA